MLARAPANVCPTKAGLYSAFCRFDEFSRRFDERIADAR
jgi:hypothetical protein